MGDSEFGWKWFTLMHSSGRLRLVVMTPIDRRGIEVRWEQAGIEEEQACPVVREPAREFWELGFFFLI